MANSPTGESPPDRSTEVWMVQGILQPFRLDAVTLALEELPGFGGMTVSECRGLGRKTRERGPLGGEAGALARQETGLTDFSAKIRIDIAVAGRDRADAIAEVIARTAHTGRPGDGKVFLWPIVHAVSVRTFDIGPRAL